MSAYQNALDEIAKLVAKVDGFKPHLEICEAITAEFPEFSLTVSCGYGVLHVQGALLSAHNLKSFDELLPVGRALARKGYVLNKGEDYPEIRRRMFDYGPIKLMGFLTYGDGAMCEFVKVGTKEEPIYELQCAGERVAA